MASSADVAMTPTLHHVTLRTGQLEQMIAWYAQAVGMRIQFAFADGVWLTNDAANHRIAFLSAPTICDDPEKIAHAGIHHSAFEFASGEDLLRHYERLRDVGIVPHFALDHGMTVSFYYLDPDRNAVELQYDVYGDWKASSEWMRTSDEFARDPIGTAVDPEKMVAAWRAGAGLDELHQRARAGEFLPQRELDLLMPPPQA